LGPPDRNFKGDQTMRSLWLTLLVVLAAGAGVGLYRESAVLSQAQDMSPLGFTVHNLGEDVIGTDSAQGTLQMINEAAGEVGVTTTDNVALTFRVDAATQVYRGDRLVSPKDLRTGERVMIVYRMDQDQRLAQSITIQQRN